MANINLLPWREERRAQKKQEFLVILGAVVAAAVVLVLLIGMVMSGFVSAQQSRNDYLQQAITTLDQKIVEIKDLREQKELLLSRTQVIQELQGNRPVIVQVFDQVAKILPDGVFFKELRVQDGQLSLVGVAESNTRISTLMRNFDDSRWFTSPNLTAVRKVSESSELWNEFDLTVQQVIPAMNTDEEAQ